MGIMATCTTGITTMTTIGAMITRIITMIGITITKITMTDLLNPAALLPAFANERARARSQPHLQ
jgi:hypothetical protein